MEKILLSTGDSVSAILVGPRWEAVIKLLPESNVVIITDENVFELYGSRFPSFPVLKIKPGEESKQLKVIGSLAGSLLRKGIDRSGFILGIGGGVVCDVAGFLASVYMRGIRSGFISTSLLSQVDASTGGKNGVNLGNTKNVIGTFRQPEFVICDTTMLRTLPEEEYLSGLAELIKTGIVGDPGILDLLEKNHSKVLLRDRTMLTELVYRSAKFKASVVARDEKEAGLRRILNFGHTFGHAVELRESVKHGFAVASGMELAIAFSQAKGYMGEDNAFRIMDILKRFNLLKKYNIPADSIKRLILHDKKKSGSEIHFVFIREPGKPVVKKITIDEVVDFYKKYQKA